MDLPTFQQWEALELHDYGGCGEVFLARNEADEPVALKRLEDLSVSRRMLAKMTERLAAEAWPEGVMPLLGASLSSSPLMLVMPWHADWNDEDGWHSRSLQHAIDDYPKKDAWPLIRELAAALARMHAKHVPHGNLKPGNLFFDDEGKLLASDWCLGNVPGVHLFNFTDALLYQPPEQLLDPSGYLDEQGYGWDVFAFGVLAYRLLTGHFPRCNEVFSQVAPPPGETRCDGLKAEPEKVAHNLERAPKPTWPDKPAGELEQRQREWVMRCLEIDPMKRPASMLEVAAGLGMIEEQLKQEHEYQRVVTLNQRAKRRIAALLTVLTACAVAILVLAGLWRFAEARLASEKRDIKQERSRLTTAAETAKRSESVARKAEAGLRRELAEDRAHYRSQLQASRKVADRLFAWAMEKDRRQLPPLDGREKRLRKLEADLVAFIEEAEPMPELEKEVARARLQLAEISISLGEAKLASERFEAAYAAWRDREIDPDLKMRMATDSLLIAKLMEGKVHAERARKSFERARALLSELDAAEVGRDRLDQLHAVLDYREAKLLAQQGDEVKALGQLMRATETLNRIASQRPDVALLHSALADCYLSSASILEGIGNPGDAREARLLAVGELLALRKANPQDLDVQDELAACYSAMAEASFLSGDLEGTSQRVEQALDLLKGYLAKRPHDDDALVRKAALLALRGGILRDRGKGDGSIAHYNEAQSILEDVLKRQPEHPMASYRLALVWWQKGRMLGINGNSAAEMAFLVKASNLLEQIEKRGDEAGPGPEQLKRSRAYLQGDIGHACELAGKSRQSEASLKRAIILWQELSEMRPRSEEYQQALEWCRERVERMGSIRKVD
ncbi:MAG: hypothetical protein R3242_01755 [Akkermansiaceae bacterium]|nr:hypothetical protein [Akkermansiaceae bacterium]